MFNWAALQPAPRGELNPQYLRQSILHGELAKDIQLVGLLIGTPRWAAADPAHGPRSIPRNLYLPWDHPDNYWGRFVERVAREYSDQVEDWIIWNEPDIVPGSPDDAYATWAGSVEDYYQLLQVGYRAVKRGNPVARVHLAGLTYWADANAGRPQYFERLLALVAADASAVVYNHYFDVVTLNLYSDPMTLYRVPLLYHRLMADAGIDKPIWIGETNIIPYDDPANKGTGFDEPGEMRCTLDDQASFVLQAFSLALAGGAERVALYKAVDGDGADAMERAGLIRKDGSRRPAFEAYQVAARYFSQTEVARYVPARQFGAVVLQRSGGYQITALWNTGPSPVVVQLAAHAANADLIDSRGDSKPLSPDTSGTYSIPLAPAGCRRQRTESGHYVIGGPTILVVE